MIYILPLTSSTSQSFLSLSYNCTSIQNRWRYVHRMNDKLDINRCAVCNVGSFFCAVGVRWNPTSTPSSFTFISAKNEVHRFECDLLLSENPHSEFRLEVGSNTAKSFLFFPFGIYKCNTRTVRPPPPPPTLAPRKPESACKQNSKKHVLGLWRQQV